MLFTCPSVPTAAGSGLWDGSSQLWGVPRRADSCPVLPSVVTTVPVLSCSGASHGQHSSQQLHQQHTQTPPFSWDTGEGHLQTRNTSPYCTALEPSGTASSSLVPPSSRGFELGAAEGARSGLHRHTRIIPFPLPREEQQRAEGWIPRGQQSSANVLRAGWGYWDSSTSQTLPPKRLKKYL